jgi:hypothetical protein
MFELTRHPLPQSINNTNIEDTISVTAINAQNMDVRYTLARGQQCTYLYKILALGYTLISLYDYITAY